MPQLASDVQAIRQSFPFLRRRINGKPITYLDNAATTQKPQQVIDALCDYYANHCANTHRAPYFLGQEATTLFEGARQKVARFLRCQECEIIFLRNATEAINLVSHALNRPGDVLVPLSEHHSNMLPWRFKRRVRYVNLNRDGTPDIDDFRRKLTPDVALVAFAAVSNVLGISNPVHEFIELARKNGSLTCVDASQAVAHFPVDVHSLECDFLAFSGHKLYAPSGIGVLYGREERLEELLDFQVGGGAVKDVDRAGHLSQDLPWRFEAGTPNIEGAIGLGAAIDFVEELGFDWIQEHEQEVLTHTLNELLRAGGVKIHGPTKDARGRSGIISFSLDGIDSHVVARVFADRENIMVRAGFHCAHPLHADLGIGPTIRASFGLYNTVAEADLMIGVLRNILRVL